jgi:hypothetical protein
LRNFSLLFLFFVFPAILPVACNQSLPTAAPSSPALRSFYLTFTPTPLPMGSVTSTPTRTGTAQTSTPTPTNTPNPGCPSVADITVNINGADYEGDTAGHTLPPGINLDQAGSFNGDLLTFTLSGPQTLDFSLCPTEDIQRNLALYIRPNCSSSTGEAYNAGFCLGLPQITGLSLPAGTYYAILSANGGASTLTSYSLRVKTGSVASAVCTVVPSVSPVAVTAGTYQNCSNVFPLNGGSPLGTGQAIATGQLDDTTNTDDFYTFTTSHSGTVTVTLDCFDNGMNNVDFDIYAATTCPTDGTDPLLIASGATTDPVEQFTINAAAGTPYYIDVSAFLGGGNYRLTVQAP